MPSNPNDPNDPNNVAGGQTSNQPGTNNPNPGGKAQDAFNGGQSMNAETMGESSWGGDNEFSSSTSSSGIQNAYTRDHSPTIDKNGVYHDAAVWGYSDPSKGGFIYADPTAFQDPNAQNIYGVTNNAINNRANQAAYQAQNTNLGRTPSIAAQMMLSGAQIAPQMMVNAPTLNTASDLQYQAGQNAQINQLAQIAAGNGPSVAATQAQQQAQANIAAEMGALGGQRSGNPALAARAAQMQASQANQGAAQAGALGRAQEAMTAQQQLAAALSGARGQTQATNTTQAQLAAQALGQNQSAFNQAGTQQANLNQNAGLANQQLSGQVSQNATQLAQAAQLAQFNANQQTSLANQSAAETQAGLNNQEYNAGLAAYMQQNQQDISNNAAYQQMIAQEQEAVQSLNYNQAIAADNNNMGLMGAAMSAAGGLLAMSDRAAKQNIRFAARPVASMLDRMAEAMGLSY